MNNVTVLFFSGWALFLAGFVFGAWYGTSITRRKYAAAIGFVESLEDPDHDAKH